MIRFRSTATGDVQMFDHDGKQLLAAIGKTDPVRGVIMPAEMGAAIARLQEAIADEPIRTPDFDPRERTGDQHHDDAVEIVSLAQRAFPFLEMLRRAQAAEAPILWGT